MVKTRSLIPPPLLRRFCWALPGLLLAFLPGCVGEGKSPGAGDPAAIAPAAGSEAGPAASLEREDRKLASRIAGALDDRRLAAQVIITGVDGKGLLGESMGALLELVPAGGIMLFAYNLGTEQDAIPSFLVSVSRCIAGSGIPPFIAVDHEGGRVQRFGPPFRRLPAPAAYWDLAQSRGRDYALKAIEEDALFSGRELREAGVSLNFAPVAEIAGPGNQAFLGDRSYGPDAAFVTEAAGAFIRGMAAAGILCVVKHFPGNSGADPHRETALLAGDSAALDSMTAPFAALIRGGDPAGVMVSHVLAPGWDGERIASLSPFVMGDKLRGELGFTGIILGDDFFMDAARLSGLSPEGAAVEALIAGADMVMAWPMNLRAMQGAILSAVREGRLSREELREKAERILYQKIRSGLVNRSESNRKGE
ncbi:MAG: glycoside hydrolase family 3 protein [Spirochaetaceae bacterium]|jgi:beta-N-acetylhexosaminidase|nr:glycoside hydrolase family 3 protein [Spirochaetaceae bacterium]